MAALNRNDQAGTGVLQTWLQRKTLENLRAKLYYMAFGQKPTTPTGYNTVSWARFTRLESSAVTTGTTSNDGVTPADTAFNASSITATPTQYRVVVSISDVVIGNNVIDFLRGAAVEVGNAMAEKIDAVIQTEVMAGTNVIYAGTATARTGIAVTDILTATHLSQAAAYLRSKSSPTFDGGSYIGLIHPFQALDLRTNTAVGAWLDANKYATPDKIFQGEVGKLGGIRIIEAPFQQTFASTVTVYPALFIGSDAYGVSNFDALQVLMTPATASDSDPLAQRRKVGAKVMFVPKRLQEDSMLRIETGSAGVTLD